MRTLLTAVLFCASFTAVAQAVPECPSTTLPPSWTSTELGAFRVDLPADATFRKPPLSLDYESGSWTLGNGTVVFYQFGFDVDSLDRPAAAIDTLRCTFRIGRRTATLLRYRTARGAYAFGFHVPNLKTFYPGTGELADGLTLAGYGADESAYEFALAVSQSVRFSRLPAAATGIYSTPKVDAQGLSIHIAGDLVSVLWATYEPELGTPLWLSGAGERLDVYYNPGSLGQDVWPYETDVTFYHAPLGVFPVHTGPVPRLAMRGRATLRLSDDCSKGQLAFSVSSTFGELSGTLPLNRFGPTEGDCSRFSK